MSQAVSYHSLVGQNSPWNSSCSWDFPLDFSTDGPVSLHRHGQTDGALQLVNHSNHPGWLQDRGRFLSGCLVAAGEAGVGVGGWEGEPYRAAQMTQIHGRGQSLLLAVGPKGPAPPCFSKWVLGISWFKPPGLPFFRI